MVQQDKKILAHQPVPGYRPAFFVIFAASVLYLGWIFLQSV